MAPREELKKQVLAQVIIVMREARDNGSDGWQEAERRFPGIPVDIIAEAWGALNDEEDSAWWEALEKTIDGEIVRRAMEAPPNSGENGDAPALPPPNALPL